jgi:hypothetical protein
MAYIHTKDLAKAINNVEHLKEGDIMNYENMNELVEDVKQYHGMLPCDLSNYLSIKHRINDALERNDTKDAHANMRSLVGLYADFTRVRWTPLMQDVRKDFVTATTEIEYEFCKNYLTGQFDIEKGIRNHWMLTDWDAYYNTTPSQYVNACRIADKIMGVDHKEKEQAQYYMEDKDYNFVDVYVTQYTHYIYACFNNEEDAIKWSTIIYDYTDTIEEEDGMYWACQPAY